MNDLSSTNKINCDNKVFNKYIEYPKIKSKINELAEKLNNHYSNKSPLVIGVLNGSIYFMMDILRKINFKYEIDFIMARSYKGTKRSKLNTNKIISRRYKNKDILVIEDIIDSGHTMNKIYKDLLSCKPKDIKVITLLNKNTKKRNILFDIDWVGFNIIDKSVIGYGMDYNNLFRYLKDIYIENE